MPRSKKWPSIKIDYHETEHTASITLTSKNAVALATEILSRAEKGNTVRLRLVGKPFKRVFVQERE